MKEGDETRRVVARECYSSWYYDRLALGDAAKYTRTHTLNVSHTRYPVKNIGCVTVFWRLSLLVGNVIKVCYCTKNVECALIYVIA